MDADHAKPHVLQMYHHIVIVVLLSLLGDFLGIFFSVFIFTITLTRPVWNCKVKSWQLELSILCYKRCVQHVLEHSVINYWSIHGVHTLHSQAVALEGINDSCAPSELIRVKNYCRVRELVMWFTLKKIMWEWQFGSKKWEREDRISFALEVINVFDNTDWPHSSKIL